jgi:hypothetical protein
MRKSNFNLNQIKQILGELDRAPVAEIADRHGISKQTVYLWRKRFGVQPRSEASPDILRMLGEPLGTELQDFCAVHYGAPEINVVREAVKTFISEQLAKEPEIKNRFEKLRKERENTLNKQSFDTVK